MRPGRASAALSCRGYGGLVPEGSPCRLSIADAMFLCSAPVRRTFLWVVGFVSANLNIFEICFLGLSGPFSWSPSFRAHRTVPFCLLLGFGKCKQVRTCLLRSDRGRVCPFAMPWALGLVRIGFPASGPPRLRKRRIKSRCKGRSRELVEAHQNFKSLLKEVYYRQHILPKHPDKLTAGQERSGDGGGGGGGGGEAMESGDSGVQCQGSF